MAVRRAPPQDVQWRAGHTTPAMIEAYISNARYEAGANFGTPLPPLPSALFQRPTPEGSSGGGNGGAPEYWSNSGGLVGKCIKKTDKYVEAPGIEPGSENVDPLLLRAYSVV
jgi:hypothetical protein